MPFAATRALVARVVGWLRAAYPAGIPPEDLPPVAAVLARTLSEGEAELLADELLRSRLAPSDADLATQLRRRAGGYADPSGLARVSGRLAQAGWPLAVPAQVAESLEPETGRIQRIVDWLREGFPTGVPPKDVIPLVALLRRRLTDREVKLVAKSLRQAVIAPASPVDIGTEITRVTHDLPSAEDVRRVHDRLAKKGWPLDFPDPEQPGHAQRPGQ